MHDLRRDAPRADDRTLRLQLIATLVASIAYGAVVSLFAHCMALLISNRRHSYTRTTRLVLAVYITAMFLMSTGSAAQSVVYIVRAVCGGPARGGGGGGAYGGGVVDMNMPLFLPPAILGADGLMLWRCFILFYDNVHMRRFIYCVLGTMSLGSGVFLVVYYLPPPVVDRAFSFHSPLTPSVVLVSITTSMNLVRACLIAGRLLYHQETTRRIMGAQYGSPYARVIVIIVESCGAIVVTGTAYLALVRGADADALNGGVVLPLLLLPHVCVASPIFLVYQVARGRAFTTLAPSGIKTPDIAGLEDGCDYMGPIQFRPRGTVGARGSVLESASTPQAEDTEDKPPQPDNCEDRLC